MPSKKTIWKTRLFIICMLLPALSVVCVVVVFPIISTVLKSLIDSNTGSLTLDNYVYLFSNKVAKAHMLFTIKITLSTVTFTLILSYLLALYLRFSNSRISRFIGTVYLLPRFIPSLVAVYAIKLVIGDSGLLNRLSLLLPENCALYNLKPGLLYNENGIILVNLWFNIPFATMIISAALSKIPDSVIESARDVGGSRTRVFFKMILPLSLRDVMIAATFMFMSNISAFTTSYLIGPNHPLMLGVYLRQQFSIRNYERAAALSVVIFLLSLGSATIYLYTNLKDRDWE